MRPADAAARARIEGDRRLALASLGAVAIIA
jgi:hypothetical protein